MGGRAEMIEQSLSASKSGISDIIFIISSSRFNLDGSLGLGLARGLLALNCQQINGYQGSLQRKRSQNKY